MLKKGFGLWLTAFAVAALLFTGCPQPVDSGGTSIPLPDGWYKGSALPSYDDGYGIEAGILTYYTNGSRDIGFAGRVESYNNDVAIIKITDGFNWGLPEGKYYGVYIGDVTGFSFTGSSAYKTSGENSGLDTPEAARAEYTDANGYFVFKAGYGWYTGEASIGLTASLQVNWAAVPGASGYDVYASDSSTPPVSETSPSVPDITGTTATIPGLDSTKTYHVWVRAKNGSRTGAWVYQGSGSPEA
jgi:hypothetical protein